MSMFPPNFTWGAATAAYQIEGAAGEDGRGESIWDRFSHTPGKTLGGDTGDIACDHYHRSRDDTALMQELGLTAYRFSLSWPRLFPTGAGPLNTRGLDFYQRLVDSLLERGITPFVTLYHWDLPQALEDTGGWPKPDTAERFADYAGAAFAALGDRVKHWITLNEPWCVAYLGYGNGIHAPGQASLGRCLAAGHTLLLAHGLAVQRFRAAGQGGQIGLTDNVSPCHPASEGEADRQAADRWDAWMNRWFLDPIYTGEYPALLRAAFGDQMPHFTDAQRAIVQAPTDFLGINYYSRALVSHDPSDPLLQTRGIVPAGAPVQAMDWEIYPDGLREILLQLRDRYADPILYVTENGAAFDEQPDGDSVVHDENRRVFLRDHIRAAGDAIAAGVHLAGYFAWSLLDNFEWALGYSKRFGLVHVDYATQKRTPKDSARWYTRTIGANAPAD